MKNASYIILVLLLLIATAVFVTRGIERARPSLAVLDLAMTGHRPNVDDWSVGLTDYFAYLLQEQGAATLPRHELGYALVATGSKTDDLAAIAQTVRSRLPQIKYVLDGTIADMSDGRFAMTVTVDDVGSDRPVAEFRGSGRYPQDRSRVLGELATAALEHAGNSATIMTLRPTTEKFTDIPDVALLFFKGLEHYRNGRPEFAAEYFRHAYVNDSEFLLSAVGWMKSYEYLGLTGQVDLLRKHILDRSQWPRIFPMLASTYVHETGGLVLNVRSADPNDSQHILLQEIVAGALRNFPAIQLLSTEWIERSIDNLGLKFRQPSRIHRLSEMRWPVQDASIVVATRPGVSNHQAMIQLQLVDGLSGAVVAQAERPSNRSEWEETSQILLENLLKDRLGPKVSYRALRQLEPPDYPWPERGISSYSVYAYAYFLRAFSDDTTNRAKIAAHYETNRPHLQSGVFPHVRVLQRSYRRLL